MPYSRQSCAASPLLPSVACGVTLDRMGRTRALHPLTGVAVLQADKPLTSNTVAVSGISLANVLDCMFNLFVCGLSSFAQLAYFLDGIDC